MSRLLALVTVALLTAACGDAFTAPNQKPSRATVTSPSAAPAPAEPDGVIVLGANVARVEPAAVEDDVTALTEAQADFAIDLYHAVRGEVDGDLVIGPSSLHTVLAMIRAGAAGSTASEMDAVLHADGLELHAVANALDRRLQDRNTADGIELAIGNRLWVQDGLQLTDSYVDTVASNYGAGLAATDFTTDPDAARRTVNRWVADATQDKITELFPEGSLDSTTRLVLANAVYLDAAWRFPFDPERTADAPFTLTDGSRVQVPTMHYDEFLPTAIGPDWAAVKLPYDGDQLSMIVIVPQDLTTFERQLDPDRLSDILGRISDGGIHLSMPRFVARTHLSLTDTLASMGMPTAFGGAADLSGMMGDSGLFIQAVEHEAVVEVDEEGTEAAAASGGAMAVSHGPNVTVDRPFLFLIRDEPTGAALFMGRVTDPR